MEPARTVEVMLDTEHLKETTTKLNNHSALRAAIGYLATWTLTTLDAAFSATEKQTSWRCTLTPKKLGVTLLAPFGGGEQYTFHR